MSNPTRNFVYIVLLSVGIIITNHKNKKAFEGLVESDRQLGGICKQSSQIDSMTLIVLENLDRVDPLLWEAKCK